MEPANASQAAGANSPQVSQFAAAGRLFSRHGIELRIVACLRDRIPDLQGVHVTAIGSTAVLRGELPSSHDKWICLECCRHVPGVIRVVDELIVVEEVLPS